MPPYTSFMVSGMNPYGKYTSDEFSAITQRQNAAVRAALARDQLQMEQQRSIADREARASSAQKTLDFEREKQAASLPLKEAQAGYYSGLTTQAETKALRDKLEYGRKQEERDAKLARGKEMIPTPESLYRAPKTVKGPFDVEMYTTPGSPSMMERRNVDEAIDRRTLEEKLRGTIQSRRVSEERTKVYQAQLAQTKAEEKEKKEMKAQVTKLMAGLPAGQRKQWESLRVLTNMDHFMKGTPEMKKQLLESLNLIAKAQAFEELGDFDMQTKIVEESQTPEHLARLNTMGLKLEEADNALILSEGSVASEEVGAIGRAVDSILPSILALEPAQQAALVDSIARNDEALLRLFPRSAQAGIITSMKIDEKEQLRQALLGKLGFSYGRVKGQTYPWWKEAAAAVVGFLSYLPMKLIEAEGLGGEWLDSWKREKYGHGPTRQPGGPGANILSGVSVREALAEQRRQMEDNKRAKQDSLRR